MMTWLSHGIDAWTSLYSNSAAWRTAVVFAHIVGLVFSGGTAITADRATLAARRRSIEDRLAQVRVLHGTHRTVVVGLIVVFASGLMLLAADLEVYLYSWVFWTKMGMIALLVVNGRLLVRAGRLALEGDGRAWNRLAWGSTASLVLWVLTTLLGAGLPNV